MKGKKLTQNRSGKVNQKKATTLENTSISPDDPLLVQKKLRDLHRAQIEKNLRSNSELQKKIDALDKIISSVESNSGGPVVSTDPGGPWGGHDNIICEPNITEIAPGKFSCLFVDQWPEADAKGTMKCASAVSDDGSARVCAAGTAQSAFNQVP